MVIKKSILSILFTFVILAVSAQDIPEHISYTRIYDYLDELATDGIIELNSVAKPYSRLFIAKKLLEAQTHKDLNKRQLEELRFFLNEFALEQDKLHDSKLNLIKNDLLNLALIQPAFNYRDTLFLARITPLLGMDI